jgi:hypothetical protein
MPPVVFCHELTWPLLTLGDSGIYFLGQSTCRADSITPDNRVIVRMVVDTEDLQFNVSFIQSLVDAWYTSHSLPQVKATIYEDRIELRILWMRQPAPFNSELKTGNSRAIKNLLEILQHSIVSSTGNSFYVRTELCCMCQPVFVSIQSVLIVV